MNFYPTAKADIVTREMINRIEWSELAASMQPSLFDHHTKIKDKYRSGKSKDKLLRVFHYRTFGMERGT